MRFTMRLLLDLALQVKKCNSTGRIAKFRISCNSFLHIDKCKVKIEWLNHSHSVDEVQVQALKRQSQRLHY